MKTTIIEPGHSGHRLMYVARMIRDARALGHDVTLVSTETAASSGQWHEFIAPVLTDDVDVRLGTVDMQMMRALIDTASDIDQLFVPDGDRWLMTAASRLPVTGSATLLLMRPRSRGWQDWLSYWVKGAFARAAEFRGWRVCTLSSPLGTDPALIHPSLRRYSQVCDPIPDRLVTAGSFRREHQIPEEDVLAVCVGAIDRRKSALEIAQWAKESTVDNLVVAFVGKIHSDIRDELCSMQGPNLVLTDSFATDQELAEAYAACDVVLVLHENEGSSGALAYAIAYRKPVVGWGSRILVDAVEKWATGIVITDRTPSSLDAAIQKIHRQKTTGALPSLAAQPRFLASLMKNKSTTAR